MAFARPSVHPPVCQFRWDP